jgi:putative SOS response-associated peptidase YedK
MCGRYTLTSQAELVTELELSRGEPLEASEWWRPRFNVAPTQPAPVVTLDESGGRVITLMRWGLVPHWADDLSIGARMINARAEGIVDKPAFRDAIKKRRCLVPADGFFEWKTITGKRRQPQWIRPEPRRIVTFAGVWAKWRRGEGPRVESFSILTVAAGPLVTPVHDRMPFVLSPAGRAAWLDPSIDDRDAIEAMIDEAGALDGWVMSPVSMRVNKADNDDPACLDPPSPDELAITPEPRPAKAPKKPARRKKTPSGQGSLF